MILVVIVSFLIFCVSASYGFPIQIHLKNQRIFSYPISIIFSYQKNLRTKLKQIMHKICHTHTVTDVYYKHTQL